MITREQLEVVANANGADKFYQEKEYLQKIFLRQLYRRRRELVFKGGTCLKICYRHQRYSEDLDFDCKETAERTEGLVEEAADGFALLGIGHEFAKRERFESAYSCVIRLKGPLYTGNPRSLNSIRIDVGDRGRLLLEPRLVNVTSEYPGVDNFLVLAMQREEILLEKICALKSRKAARDLFDLWELLESGVRLRRELLARKMRERGVAARRMSFASRREFEEDLGGLVPTLPDYSDVIARVKALKV